MNIFSLIAILVAISLFTTIIPDSFAAIESPLKQMKKGVLAKDVVCREGLYLLIRNSGDAICVRQKTAERLEGLGTILQNLGISKVKTDSLESISIKDAIKASESQQYKNLIETVPASSKTVINFYLNDDDLNTSPRGVDIISTQGILEFYISGVLIPGPEKMIETGVDSGKFYLKLDLPPEINGRQISQNDIIEIRYLDQSDYAGEKRVIVESISLEKTFAQIQSYGGGSRIGHEFVVRLYEPDYNRDSKDVDRIPLSKLEFRAEGGIRTTLANPRFDANSAYLLETGDNTSTFEVKIKIPREIDGKTIHIGDWYEIRYIDTSTPSNTSEKIILKGRIG